MRRQGRDTITVRLGTNRDSSNPGKQISPTRKDDFLAWAARDNVLIDILGAAEAAAFAGLPGLSPIKPVGLQLPPSSFTRAVCE